MTELVWNATGERYFESGIARGVVYPRFGPGVAWNGLKSVTESSDNSDGKAYHYDDFHYRNSFGNEVFAAKIEAFSAPVEFLDLDGLATITRGFYAAHQRVPRFGMSYRTNIGNDVNGTSLGYKIHLVFNARVKSSEINRATISNTIEPLVFSWDIDTVPVRLPGYKPSTHLFVDSRKTDPDVLVRLERVLYGSEDSNPWLPDLTQIPNLFAPGGVYGSGGPYGSGRYGLSNLFATGGEYGSGETYGSGQYGLSNLFATGGEYGSGETYGSGQYGLSV